ncbi:MAG: restriction endonuclease [Candidatus Latescibacteria bacterium]|nr:restriction endonuclease [Candidatus Latescibacterota bacterium]
MQVVELEEEQPFQLARQLLSQADALRLHQRHHHQLQLDFPNPLHPSHYILRSRGWAGQLTIGGLLIQLRPKIPLRNLFGMIETAYQFKGLHFFAGQGRIQSLEEIFSHLAELLTRGIQARLHQGLYREYLECQEDLPYLRGRMLFPPARRPQTLRCAYQEHSAGGMDNRILSWTLHCMRGFSFAQEATQRQVRQVYRLVSAAVEPTPVHAEECLNRPYHRLNQDYQILHALCRFFLEHSGPAAGPGDRAFLPFAVHLPTLFEGFVAHWLKAQLPAGLHLEVQHRALVEGSRGLAFHIDLVLRAGEGGEVLAVLDTKYKGDQEPSSEDIQQVVAYAVRLGTRRAFLLYPSARTQARRLRVGEVQVQTLSFELGGDLEAAGSVALGEVLKRVKYA